MVHVGGCDDFGALVGSGGGNGCGEGCEGIYMWLLGMHVLVVVLVVMHYLTSMSDSSSTMVLSSWSMIVAR